MPQPGCIIKFPRKGRKGKKGFKEEDFNSYLIKYFNNDFRIYDDRFVLVTGSSNPFEPDFTFTNEKNGINIFVDIEIDEPYEGLNDIAERKVTHFQYADTFRNNAFKNRGWIVIRFAEIQIHREPLQCCLFIADVIKSINSKYNKPKTLNGINEITLIKQWTESEAQQWSIENYREKYLGIERFGVVQENERLEGLKETELGKKIEEEIEEEPPKKRSVEHSIKFTNPRKNNIDTAIRRSIYLAFEYQKNATVVKPIELKKDTFIAFCYLKNKEIEYNIYEIQGLILKENPFTMKETGPDLGLNSVRDIISIAIKYNKLIRMKYTRTAWTETFFDQETGEVFNDQIEAETTFRTISKVDYALNVLAEDRIEKYNLRNDEYEYLSAYCHLREGQRTFRFDRISEIAILNV
jgi:hypothetical protein